ncbi:DUF6261 family protein [Sunxiuqinia elliptica]|uniref:Uncharacterized protein n=1 Tax=Sunxiuqinia elliptica TaxID=655355 RepID=A0A4R6H5C1_9BACT|nr:DUF6261 family protein [Sunxiuqinia elliptica]TDO03134.1 hypothetical protein DET52_10373 [Sunxiuqinia elliptica]TDO59331.1 hypothetical protein DET65_2616 [Sunxiuqinia elliptica]
MILTMNFSGLTNAELLSFGQSLDELLAPAASDIDLIYAPFEHALRVCQQTASESISKQMAQQQTQELQDADVKRDNLFRGFKYLVQAYLLHPEPAIQEAASELEKVAAKVGWNLHRKPYDQQSALMKTLFDDLANKQAERLNLLGITAYVDLLQMAQDEFDNIRKSQLEKQAELEKISSMTAVRGELEQACKDLLEILPGYHRMTGNEKLEVILPRIKELIDRTR